MEQIQKNKMGTKPIFPLLMSMALPPMLSMLIQSLYNIVDSVFVAQISTDALAAVSLAFPLQTIIIALSVGIGVGVNAYIARKLGEQNQKEANNAIVHGFIVAGIVSFLITIIGLMIVKAFFQLFTSDIVIINDACTYSYIVIAFSFGCFFHILIEKIFQSTGKMLFPMAIQALGAIINIILDPIMIFGFFGFPALGIKGAAIATIIGQLIAMSISLYILIFKKHDVKLDLKQFVFDFNIIKKILSIAIPNSIMNALGSFLVMGLNVILITYSTIAVSTYGIFFKLQTFVFMPASGLTQGAMPLMAYNYGAKNRVRLHDTIKISIIVTMIIMCVGTFIFWLFPVPLLQLFKANEEMLAIGVPALRIISLSFIPAAIGFILPTLFQSMGKGFYSLVVFLLRQCVITLPLAYLLSNAMGLNGIWISFIIAESIAAIIAYLLYLSLHKRDAVWIVKDKNSI